MDTSRVNYYHNLYKIALWFNLIMGTLFVLAFDQFYPFIANEQLPEHPLIPFFIMLIGLAIMGFGLVYYQTGRRFEYSDGNFLILLSAVAKASLFFICLWHVYFTDIPWLMMVIPTIDLIYGILFFESLIFKLKHKSV